MLTKPYKGATIADISQGYHPEHLALDMVSSYGKPLVACEDMEIIRIYGDTAIKEGKAPIEFGFGFIARGLETGNQYLYWHLWPYVPAWRGDVISRGKIVGFMGNSGLVRSGGRYVPLEERNEVPYPGTHLHFVAWDRTGEPFDPTPAINWTSEPSYNQLDLFVAWSKTLSKITKLAFR